MNGMYLVCTVGHSHSVAIWLRFSPPVNCEFPEGIVCALVKCESQGPVEGQGHSRCG